MKRHSLREAFRTTAFVHGGYAALVVVAAVVLAVGVNLVVDQIPVRLDLTANSVYSISGQTRQVLDALSSPVTVTHLLKTANDDPQVREVLRTYAAASRRLTVQTIDPELNPGWTRPFEQSGAAIREGSVVVASGKRYRVIVRADMYNTTYTNPDSPPTITSLALEQRLTSAMRYVTAERNPVLYTLQGHREESFASLGAQRELEGENWDVKSLNLLALPEVPADADLIVIINPKNDLTGPDVEKLLAYMGRGGRLLVSVDPRPLENLNELLKAHGLALDPFLIAEGDGKHHTGNPFFLLPDLELHAITKPLRAEDIPVIFPFSQAVRVLELRKRSLRVEPLMVTSANSWGKPDIADLKTVEKETRDPVGPFNVAVAVTEPAGDNRPKDGRLVVLGSYRFLLQPFFSLTTGNKDFLLNVVNWLGERKEGITVRPKDLVQYPLTMNNRMKVLYSVIVVILMPLIVFSLGFGVWMRRRHQ